MPTPASPPQAAVFTPRWTLFSRSQDTDDASDPGTERARAVQAAWAEGDRSGLLLGRFELLRRLGRGGMGEVYEALYRGDRQRYAVKILDRGHREDPSMVTRFEHEFWALTRCRHPGVVAPHFSGEIDGELFYSMELLRGESLEDTLRRGPLAPARVVRIGIQLCEALEVLHDAGVLHRDLKPGNILLLDAADGDRDRVKLVDLGIAKLLPRFYENVEARTPPEERLRTKAGVRLGTPGYVAPEVGLGAPPAVKQDVFSLGVTLFRLATGRLPYPPMASIEAGDEPRWSEELGRPLPTIFELALRRAMTADPATRTPTVERLREELEDVAAELDADTLRHDQPTARLDAPRTRDTAWSRVGAPALWISIGALLAGAGAYATQVTQPEGRMSWSIALAQSTQETVREYGRTAPTEAEPLAEVPAALPASASTAPSDGGTTTSSTAALIPAPADPTPAQGPADEPSPARSAKMQARRWARDHDRTLQRCLGSVGGDGVVVSLEVSRQGAVESLDTPSTVPALANRCLLDVFEELDLGPDAPPVIRLKLKKRSAKR